MRFFFYTLYNLLKFNCKMHLSQNLDITKIIEVHDSKDISFKH